MTGWTEHQFSVSTAEDEINYFTGQSKGHPISERPVLPSGIYRVIDGHLYRIVPGVMPANQRIRQEDSLAR